MTKSKQTPKVEKHAEDSMDHVTCKARSESGEEPLCCVCHPHDGCTL